MMPDYRSRRKRKLAIAALAFFVLGATGVYPITRAQTIHPSLLENKSDEEYKVLLREIEARISEHRASLDELQKQSATLARQLSILRKEIDKAKLEIRATALHIEAITNELAERERAIQRLNLQVADKHAALAEMLRTLNHHDRTTALEILLSTNSLSDFFGSVNALEDLQAQILLLLTDMRRLKQELLAERDALAAERARFMQLKELQQIQVTALEEREKEEAELLARTQGEERRFQRLIADEAENARLVSSKLFRLEQFSVELPFAQAYAYAKKASEHTGVRPALLLAILLKESRWGKNLGSGHWRIDMHPDQHEAFAAITKSLGLDPNRTPISAKPDYGWGGAMGPAQFLPKTWLGYVDEIAKITGHRPPSPWNIEDAFTGAAIKLGRDGAYVRTPETEWRAAMVYFAGGNWDNSAFRFYGDSVMELTNSLQKEIERLTL